MTVLQQPSRSTYLHWAIVFSIRIWRSSPRPSPEELGGEKHALRSLLCLSHPTADEPQAKGVRYCQEEAQGNLSFPLGIYLLCRSLSVSAFLRCDMSWAGVYFGRWDEYEVFWWYDCYYSTWMAMAFILDHTVCYLLYAVSHGWMCNFVFGILTP